MLRACRRVLKPGGRIAYYTIFISHEIPEDARRRIGKVARPGLYTRAEQQGLLRSAGFVNIEETDVTDEYLHVERALHEANERHARSLRKSLGEAKFEEAQSNRKAALLGIEGGVLRRSLFVAERPRRATR